MIDGGDGAPEPGYVSMMCRDGTGTPFRPVRIAGARVRIGRRAENDLIISNPSVSRQHAEIFAEAGRWFIVDNDSKFGTYLNGERVVRAPVTPGDEIRLGGEDGPLIVFGATGDEAVEDGPLVDTVEPPTTGRGEMPIVAGGVPASSDAAMGLVEQFRATSLLGDYRQALSTVVDAALRLTQFDCAALCLADANTTATPDVRVDVWRTRMDAGTLNTDRVTRIVVDTVASAVMLVSSCDDDAAKDRDERARPAVEAGMRQVVCIPIVTAYDVPLVAPGGARATTIGALYLEESSGAPSVTGHIVDVLASLANEAGAVLERSNASQRDIALAREQLALVASENAMRANDASLPMSERARAACALAEFQQLIGDIDGALAALEAFFETSARAKLPEVERARVLKTIGVTHMWRAKWHVAVGMLNAALDALASATDVALEMETLAMLARCYSEIGELELAREFVLKAITVLRREAGVSPAYCNALLVAGVIAENDGDFASAAHAYREALRISEASTNIVTLVAAHYRLGRVHFLRGDTADATASLQRMLEIAHPMGNTTHLALGQAALAACLVRAGAWRRADAVIAAGLVTARRAERHDALAHLLVMAATIAVHRDGGAAGEAAIAAVREHADETGNRAEAFEADILDAELSTASGAHDAARRALQASIARAGDGADSAMRARLYLALADVERHLGDMASSHASVELAHQALGASRDLRVAGLVQRAVGRVHADAGRQTEAQHSLAQSLSVFRTIDDQRLVALTHLDLGNLMLAASDPACARMHLRQARDVFAELGIAALTSAADAALQTAMSRGGVSSGVSYSSVVLGARSEPRFVRRLLEAAQSRELLLCELTALALDIAHATSALVVGIGAGGGVTVVASSGAKPSGGLPVERLREAAAGDIVRLSNSAVYPLESASGPSARGAASVLVLDIAVPHGSRADTALQLVVQLARQGLELVALRDTAGGAARRGSDPLVPILPASVDIGGEVLLYESAGMRQLAERLQRIRSSSSTVLITGESGVGKEVVARAIHAMVPRAKAPFVPFNCTAVPRELIESQIFGHRKGAFTGATADYPGVARSATNGTLFLDEIGDLPLDVQPKFLRFLESGEIFPLGATAPLRVDVRVVAATNANLEELVEQRRFREDLYHRLNIIRLHVPPLRERRADIPLLANHFLSRAASRAGVATVPRLSEDALAAFLDYAWPGNVRELRNEIERIVTFGAEGSQIMRDHLSDEIRFAAGESKPAVPAGGPSSDLLTERMRQFEIDEIQRALTAEGMNLTRAASALGIARQNLQRRIKKLGLSSGDS